VIGGDEVVADQQRKGQQAASPGFAGVGAAAAE
jgi:hypothetical protein